MLDSGQPQNLLETIKKAAVEAMDATKPVNVCFGVVINESPLEILVDQKLKLNMNQMILSRNVTDFDTPISMLQSNGWDTLYRGGGAGDPSFTSHNHDINKVHHIITIHNRLLKGDEVIMIRQQDGQKYIVWDRVGKP